MNLIVKVPILIYCNLSLLFIRRLDLSIVNIDWLLSEFIKRRWAYCFGYLRIQIRFWLDVLQILIHVSLKKNLFVLTRIHLWRIIDTVFAWSFGRKWNQYSLRFLLMRLVITIVKINIQLIPWLWWQIVLFGERYSLNVLFTRKLIYSCLQLMCSFLQSFSLLSISEGVWSFINNNQRRGLISHACKVLELLLNLLKTLLLSNLCHCLSQLLHLAKIFGSLFVLVFSFYKHGRNLSMLAHERAHRMIDYPCFFQPKKGSLTFVFKSSLVEIAIHGSKLTKLINLNRSCRPKMSWKVVSIDGKSCFVFWWTVRVDVDGGIWRWNSWLQPASTLKQVLLGLVQNRQKQRLGFIFVISFWIRRIVRILAQG